MHSITNISLNADEILEIRSKKIKSDNKPHFNMIGTGRNGMSSTTLPTVDLLYEMNQMTSAEGFAFLTLRDNIMFLSREEGYAPFIKVSQVDMTKYQQKVFRDGIPKLIAKDLVRRVKRGVYMINPMAIIPSDFAESEKLWMELVN